jgi:hypothetical protein
VGRWREFWRSLKGERGKGYGDLVQFFWGEKFVRNSKNSQMGGVKRLNSVGRNHGIKFNSSRIFEDEICN